TEPAGKGGGSGFAAMLHQLGVGAHAAGDDGSAAKAALGDGRAAAPPTAAGQILPGQLTSGLAEISVDAGTGASATVAQPLQIPGSMSNNAAPSRLEASRLVAKHGGEIRVATAKAAPTAFQ